MGLGLGLGLGLWYGLWYGLWLRLGLGLGLGLARLAGVGAALGGPDGAAAVEDQILAAEEA